MRNWCLSKCFSQTRFLINCSFESLISIKFVGTKKDIHNFLRESFLGTLKSLNVSLVALQPPTQHLCLIVINSMSYHSTLRIVNFGSQLSKSEKIHKKYETGANATNNELTTLTERVNVIEHSRNGGTRWRIQRAIAAPKRTNRN